MDVGSLFDVRSKRALVTGGSAGIGLMIAEGLVRAGAQVWICSRKLGAVNQAVEQLSPLGNISGFAADLGTPAGIEAAGAAIDDAGPLHMLINNAGATWGAPVEQFPRAGFEKVLALNLLAPFELVKRLLPALRMAATLDDPARIINISSIDGMMSLPIWENYPYSASKAGVIQLTRHLGKFLAKDNISVNAIAPGIFPSRMTDGVFDFEDPVDQAEIASPLGGRAGQAEDIVGGVLYLSSRAGAWLTGITLPISGGRGTVS